MQAVWQAVAQNLAMTHAAELVAQHPGKAEIRLEVRQSPGHCRKGLRHAGAIDHAQYRHAKLTGKVGRRGRTVEQPHNPFNQDQISLGRRFPEQPTRLLKTHHPKVQLIYRRTTGGLQNHRIEKVRATFEHPHLAALPAVQARQRGGYRGFALPRGRRGDQHRRTATRGQNSTPFCALIPALKACLVMPISVTVSAASTSAGGAPRPVTTTC